eukprot:gene31347-53640_t
MGKSTKRSSIDTTESFSSDIFNDKLKFSWNDDLIGKLIEIYGLENANSTTEGTLKSVAWNRVVTQFNNQLDLTIEKATKEQLQSKLQSLKKSWQ